MIKKLLPPSLNTEPFKEIAEALDVQLQKVWEELINVVIYPRINEIEDEKLLDLLAHQFHVEGWELTQTVEDKRRLIKNAVELHRFKGTPYAIKKVLEALGLSGDIKEWFQYNGEPYRFKIEISSPDKEITPQLREQLLRLVEEYKNERSWLEEIILQYLVKGYCPTTYTGSVGETTSNAPLNKEISASTKGIAKVSTGAAGELSTGTRIAPAIADFPLSVSTLGGNVGETTATAPFAFEQVSISAPYLFMGAIGEVSAFGGIQ